MAAARWRGAFGAQGAPWLASAAAPGPAPVGAPGPSWESSKTPGTAATGVDGLTISGCSNENTGRVIHGTYTATKPNHDRPVFRKSEPQGGPEVYIYFWDERDGPRFRGWWIGPCVGADQVWAYHGAGDALPPESGWQVPFGAPVDAGLRVAARRPERPLRLVPAVGLNGRPPAGLEPRPRPQPPGGPPGPRGASGAEVRWIPVVRTGTNGGATIRPSAVGVPPAGRPAAARPAAVVAPRFGQVPEAAARPAAVVAQVPEARSAAVVVPCLVQVPEAAASRLRADGGRVAKRLATLTDCSIDVLRDSTQHEDASATVGVRISGEAKRRRLAAKALSEVAVGLDPEDALASASGSLVIAHGLAHEGRREWLTWRLASLEHEGRETSAQVTPGAVRVSLPGSSESTEGEDADGTSQIEPQNRIQLRYKLEQCIEEAQALVELTVESQGELALEVADAEVAIALLVAQHGLKVRVRGPSDDPVVHVLGPPVAARDAAALLWARFGQGRATAAVLQAAGCVQAMDAAMAKSFEQDMRDMEAECGVHVHQAETMLWVDGADADSVLRAKGLLREVLQFYLPEAFLWLPLGAPLLERLQQDAELRKLSAAPGCALALERDAGGGVWLCGSLREEAKRRLRALGAEC